MARPRKYATLEEYYANQRERAKAWYEANPEKAKEIRTRYYKKWRAENPELAKARDRENRAKWVANNRDKVYEQNKAYYEANKERIAQKRKEAYAKKKLEQMMKAGE